VYSFGHAALLLLVEV